MAAADKDTIYIDIDDEITGIIDKVKGSSGKVVALVLPKRAAVFQSIVNMRLLKRAADDSKKHLVLITSEAGLLPLAGAAGVHVAKTLTSKPEIPSGPDMAPEDEEAVEEEPEEIDNDEPDTSKSVGELAGPATTADGVETLVMDDEDTPPEAEEAAPATKDFTPPKGKKDKKMKIPDFDRFRLLLVGGILLLFLLIFGMVFAGSILPHATINIKTDAATADVNQNLNLSTDAKQLNTQDNTLPAKLAQTQKTYSQQVPTTGQKNNGNKASGSISMTAKECGVTSPADVPAGTGVSANGQKYITQENTPFAFWKIQSGCIYFQATGETHITAQTGGSAFNTPSGTSFSIAGRSDVSASGSASGGSDNIVRTVNQNDINSAKSKITANDSELKSTLKDSLGKDNFYAIEATYTADPPSVTNSANVGDIADNVTITETVNYKMFGVHKADLQKVIENNIKAQIDVNKQSILDNGLSKAVFNVENLSATGGQLTVATTAEVGPDLDINSIKQQAAGKKPGPVKDQLKTNPDVTDVDIKLSPFWVSSVPKKTSKIKVVIAKPTASTKSNTSNAGQ
jgi:hypothetical protein